MDEDRNVLIAQVKETRVLDNSLLWDARIVLHMPDDVNVECESGVTETTVVTFGADEGSTVELVFPDIYSARQTMVNAIRALAGEEL